jgi:hypothetical protein
LCAQLLWLGEQVSEKISDTLLAASIGLPFQTLSDRVIRSGTAPRAFAASGFLAAGCEMHRFETVLAIKTKSPVYSNQLINHLMTNGWDWPPGLTRQKGGNNSTVPFIAIGSCHGQPQQESAASFNLQVGQFFQAVFSC